MSGPSLGTKKEETMPESVRVIVKRPTGSGRRLGWNKHVTQIDTTKVGGGFPSRGIY